MPQVRPPRTGPDIIGVGGRDGTKYVLGQWPYRSVLYEARLLEREYLMSPWDNYVQKVTTGKIVIV